MHVARSVCVRNLTPSGVQVLRHCLPLPSVRKRRCCATLDAVSSLVFRFDACRICFRVRACESDAS